MNKLEEKIDKELNNYIESIKERGLDFAIKSHYELTMKSEIADVLKYDRKFDKETEKALLKEGNVLDKMYNEWLNSDGNFSEMLEYSIDEGVDKIEEKSRKQKQKER